MQLLIIKLLIFTQRILTLLTKILNLVSIVRPVESTWLLLTCLYMAHFVTDKNCFYIKKHVNCIIGLTDVDEPCRQTLSTSIITDAEVATDPIAGNATMRRAKLNISNVGVLKIEYDVQILCKQCSLNIYTFFFSYPRGSLET